MKLLKEQVDTIIKNGQQSGLTGKQVLDGLIKRGYEPEGINVIEAKKNLGIEPTFGEKVKSAVSEIVGDFKDAGKEFVQNSIKRDANVQESQNALQKGEQGAVRTALQKTGQYLGAGADAITTAGKLAVNSVLPDKVEKDITSIIGKFGSKVMEVPEVQNIINTYNALPEDQKRDVDAAGGVLDLVSNFVGGGVASKAGKVTKKVANTAVDVVSNSTKSLANEVIDVATSVKNRLPSADTIKKSIIEPGVSDAAKVSLNPTKALKGTTQDIKVSVSGKVKKLSELTDSEIEKVQLGTERNLKNFEKQAELFKNDRGVEKGSPLDIVGSRTDKAVDVADKKRQIVGKQMGAIEEKFGNNYVPVSDDTLKTFSDIVEYSKDPKYGVKSQSSEVVNKLIEDFDRVNANGLTVKERTDFVRKWQDHLKDQKDGFGQFKDNASVNTKIENAVNTLRNETVDSISDKTYKELRKKYSEYKNLEKIADQLLGKDGLYGERIKGAATIKRAIQSNSDAGARQFLAKLKELTGYDAIKEGDLAVTAMDSVGDYQQLSLLGILKDGKKGIVDKAVKSAQDFVFGNEKQKVKNYIKVKSKVN